MFGDLVGMQIDVMIFIKAWTRNHDVPIPQKNIFVHFTKQKVSPDTVSYAISSLLDKGYIRKAVSMTKAISYVMIRNI